MAAQTSTHDSSHDYELRTEDVTFSSPTSSVLSTSPQSTPFQSLADQNSTPLSMLDDSWADGNSSSKPGAGVAASASGGADIGVGGGKLTDHASQLPASPRRASTTELTEPSGPGDAAPLTKGAAAPDARDSAQTRAGSDAAKCQPAAVSDGARGCPEDIGTRSPARDDTQHLVLTPGGALTESPRNSPRLIGAPATRGQYEGAPAPAPAVDHSNNSGSATLNHTASASAPTPPSASSTSPGHAVPFTLTQIPEDRPSSHDSSSISTSPVRVASVQPHTRRAQPRPRTIIRTLSDSDSLDIKHPTPDINPRAGAYVGNIQQLEATAERLSMTSSIDDAIRDLHCELKRSDSRRSSLLAAHLRTQQSIDDYTSIYSSTSGSVVEHLQRKHSIASSIVSTNNAARHGGYSPAGYVMSPNHSLTGRLRSGSKNSSGRPDFDTENILSRHGPGKASVRSVRSTKMSLAEISESEPIALTKDALDKADASPPLKSTSHDSRLPEELRDANVPSTDVFQNMMGDDDFLDRAGADSPTADVSAGLMANQAPAPQQPHEAPRPSSSRSDTTFQQCQDAFGDFDGVHYHPESENEHESPADPAVPAAVPRQPAQHAARPQSYFDPESGQQMLYYPARVPAMLNLPPKLSNKPKAADRSNRRSQVLSMMMEGNRSSQALHLEGNRESRHMDEDTHDSKRDSYLPDPLAGHRESFAALSTEELGGFPAPETRSIRSSNGEHHEVQPEEANREPEVELRRPQRLTKADPDKRKSRMSNLPPQLRASAYFDSPADGGPDIEVKDGSAMATLDSILDASAVAPVSAFTDHKFGKLGNEVYGKEKKRASVGPNVLLKPEPVEQPAKKRSSFMWLGKRKEDKGKDKDVSGNASDSGLGPINADTQAGERDGLAGHTDDDRSRRSGDSDDEDEEAGEGENDGYQGPPTTLLAELQLRKQQQKQRTQRQFPEGMHATLLELDAVAETQRVHRKDKRVNLAWEDGDGHEEGESSDDEDVPLAIIAARSQGAQNVMDMNRPLGLMERRELEDNEPLSQRRARLHGQDPRSLMIQNRPSVMNLSANGSGVHLPRSPHSGQDASNNGEAEEDEVPGETLAERKKRLAHEEENALPKARPVSSVFSAELLSQFGDLDEDKKKKEEKAAPKAPEDETLGERRRRLQSEREAREREMSLNQLSAPMEPEGPMKMRKSMANVLGSHPLRESDLRNQEERQRVNHENMKAREREAKMAAYRSQMPANLDDPSMAPAIRVAPEVQEARMAAYRNQMPTNFNGPDVGMRSGGFRGGAFNDGTGGLGADTAMQVSMQASMSTPALHNQVYGGNSLQHRASAVFSSYGTPMQPQMPMQQPAFGGSMMNLGTMNNMGGYNGMNVMNSGMNHSMNNLSPYGGGMGAYGGGMMQPGMPMQMPMNNGGSSNRIEQWRQSVLP